MTAENRGMVILDVVIAVITMLVVDYHTRSFGLGFCAGIGQLAIQRSWSDTNYMKRR